MWIPGRVGLCMCVRGYSLINPACNALQSASHFSTLSHEWCDFRRRSYWTQNVCFDFLYNFCLKHFSFYEEFSKTSSKMAKRFHVKYPLFLSDCNETWIFPTDFRKKAHTSSLIKIRALGADLFYADEQTTMKLIVAFRNSAKERKNADICCVPYDFQSPSLNFPNQHHIVDLCTGDGQRSLWGRNLSFVHNWEERQDFKFLMNLTDV